MSSALARALAQVAGDGPLQRLAPARSIAVIDVEPGEDSAQCAACSFVPFLRGVADLPRFAVLSRLSRFFAVLPRLLEARRRRDAGALLQIAQQAGFGGVLALRDGSTPSVPGLPSIVEALSGPRADDVALVRLHADHARLLTELEQAALGGARHVLLGQLSHACAMEDFVTLMEAPELATRWFEVVTRARATFERLSFVMAYPPCAALQWAENRSLEALRARLDTQFRRLDGVASRMCPENVSGYLLLNDMERLSPFLAGAEERRMVRLGDLLFTL